MSEAPTTEAPASTPADQDDAALESELESILEGDQDDGDADSDLDDC